ncbi:LLM class flavin-dependent oxidoreductase [Mycobacterium sp. CVI_P3]|uniref:LLM class flavin-dependent oxidoreductase n=1 Tax=Mycobacterium pinniadriaticum TaxID=2994102 RepID=A0ABT3S9W6_9MYCO|nr:LLM class flavin-dependent oxidoreductase [Mycobacterium pinniadriaticum]MCX2929525.1 LLM class flavin-dependent oxidoreductase [Mycobacterium pinniadriaticum]MCX2935949.1 LLM class flavin-dependent oxidoreductase [Mycobacterium pinniadriaticum]
MLAILRFNFASPGGEPAVQGELLSAALELAQFGDRHGIAAISVDEHHATGHGWSCNPVMIAGMFLARTANIFASIDCALGPLWNPVRMAEDIALIDAMSRGRLHTTVGLGYREVEYQTLGVDFARRGELMDALLETLLASWSGGSAVVSGTWSKPHPPLYVGGGVRATARRAVRFGLPLSLPDHRPDLAEYYTELCRESGQRPFVLMPPAVNRGMIYLHEDPERAWAELGEHILWEAVTYGGWSDDPSRSVMHLPGVQTLEEVRASGRYRFLTPDQLIDEVRASANYGPIVMHPLVGGMPVEEAWRSVSLLTDEVLPALR